MIDYKDLYSILMEAIYDIEEVIERAKASCEDVFYWDEISNKAKDEENQDSPCAEL